MATVIIPWILVPVVPLLAVFLLLRRYFLRTSRDIKRLESTSNCFLFLFLLGGGGGVDMGVWGGPCPFVISDKSRPQAC